MDGAMMPSVMLDVQDLKLAQDQYADFVDIHRPILSIAEFKEQRNLALNERCATVFYAKTAHLKENDFIEIDRSILETIGFKNTFTEQKDKKGNLKLDENGQPKLKDTRADLQVLFAFSEIQQVSKKVSHLMIHMLITLFKSLVCTRAHKINEVVIMNKHFGYVKICF